jgi:hypothetical protein
METEMNARIAAFVTRADESFEAAQAAMLAQVNNPAAMVMNSAGAAVKAQRLRNHAQVVADLTSGIDELRVEVLKELGDYAEAVRRMIVSNVGQAFGEAGYAARFRWETAADAEFLGFYEEVMAEAGLANLWDARARAAANAIAMQLGQVDGQWVALRDYLALRRQCREQELRLMGIMDLIAVVRGTEGLSYTGQPKNELISLVMAKEFGQTDAVIATADQVTPQDDEDDLQGAPAPQGEPTVVEPSGAAEAAQDDRAEDDGLRTHERRQALDKCGVEHLKACAKNLQVAGVSKMKKADLINAIIAKENGE